MDKTQMAIMFLESSAAKGFFGYAKEPLRRMCIDALALKQKQEQGLVLELPVPIGAELHIDCDSEYPVTVADVGVYLSAIEEGEWNSLQEFTDFYSNVIDDYRARAEAAIKE